MLCENYKPKYNCGLDILKFIFSLLIVFSHGIFLADTQNGDKLLFGHALVGVEFFFIVSGYFLVQTYYNRNLSGFEFIKKKLSNLFPYFFTSFIFCFFTWLYFFSLSNPGRWKLGATVLKSVWELLWMSSSGVSTAGVNGTWWFLSAMLFAEWLLYPIISKYEKSYVTYWGPLSIFLLIGFLSRSYGTLAAGALAGFINSDNLRAILGISCGCLLFYISYHIRHISFRQWVRYLLALLELASYALVFYIAYKNTSTVSSHVDNNLDFVVIVLLCIGIGITTSESSVLYRLFTLFPSKSTKFLGKLSTCIYFVHWECMLILQKCSPSHWGYYRKLLYLFVLSVIVATLVIIVTNVCLRYYRTHSQKILLMFIHPRQ